MIVHNYIIFIETTNQLINIQQWTHSAIKMCTILLCNYFFHIFLSWFTTFSYMYPHFLLAIFTIIATPSTVLFATPSPFLFDFWAKSLSTLLPRRLRRNILRVPFGYPDSQDNNNTTIWVITTPFFTRPGNFEIPVL